MINAAVHGKASRADLLLAEGAAAKKSDDEDRDKTNTVDFGATLIALIDQPGISQGAIKDPGVADATAASAPASDDQRGADAPTAPGSSPFYPRDAPVGRHLSKSATPSKSATESEPESRDPTPKTPDASPIEARTHAGPTEVDPRTSIARREPITTRGTDRTSRIETTPSPHQIGALASAAEELAVPTSAAVATGDRTKQPPVSPINAPADVEVLVDSAVPDSDIALDFRKQVFPSKAANESAHTSADHFSTSAIQATIANPAQTKAEADTSPATMPGTTNSPHPHPGRANDGTSSALSSRSTSLDSMNPANSKITQAALATLGVDATSSSAQQASPAQMDLAAQVMPQDQRDRSADGKETSTPATAPAAAPNKEAHGIDTQPTSRAAEAAPIRATTEAAPTRESSRTVNITVQLAGGQTAQASVREHAGAVDVKILTPTAAAAQRVSSEMDGMRQNLDAAGIKLGHSEVSYQQGDGSGRQGQDGYRPPAQNASANGKDVFLMNEVIQ